MDAVYADYSSELVKYNDLADAYNTAMTNVATDNTTEIPPIPCAPTLPTDPKLVEFVSDKAKPQSAAQLTALSSIAKDTIYYTPINSAVDGTSGNESNLDSRKFGHLYMQADGTEAGAAYDAAA